MITALQSKKLRTANGLAQCRQILIDLPTHEVLTPEQDDSLGAVIAVLDGLFATCVDNVKQKGAA